MGIFNIFKSKINKNVETNNRMDELSKNEEIPFSIEISDDKKYIKYNEIIKNKSEEIITRGNVYSNEVYLIPNIKEKLNKKYIAFDIETTGLSTIDDRIIELGAVVFENGKPIKEFSSLVNANKKISIDAMRVNNISNEILQEAPTEKEIYPKLIDFLGDALSGETIICAHNTSFDINFLVNTLERLGYSAKIKYVDTLKSSRELIYGLKNYKLATVAKHFDIANKESHRAVTDAEVCGKVLWQLLKDEINVKEKFLNEGNKISILDDYEKIVFAYIVNLINKKGLDTDYLGARKTSNGYIVIGCLYRFIDYKYTKRGKFIIMKNKYVENIKLPKEPCTITDGGSEYSRVYFNSLDEIKMLDEYILKEYKESYKSLMDYIDGNSRKEKCVLRELECQYRISNEEAEKYVEEEIKNKVLEKYCNEIKIKKQISRNEITINPINNRIPISEIEIIGCYNWNDGWEEEKYQKWRKAELYFDKANELKQNGKYDEAIKYFDIARENGYITEYLYECYAMTYHKLKDYDNEIDILEEGMKFFSKHNGNVSILTARRDKAIQTKYSLIEKAKLQEEKNEQKKLKEEQKTKEKQERQIGIELQKNMPKEPATGRAIIQMDDNGNIIRKYISIAEAVRETGVNSKSIRDAAKGVQKHAGGYCWKYEGDVKN